MKFTALEKKILAVLFCVQFVQTYDFMILMPLGPILMKALAIDPIQVGLTVALQTFMAGLAGLLGFFFLDRFERKPALIVLGCGFLAAAITCTLAPDFWIFALARAFQGFCSGALAPVSLAIISDAVAPERRGSAMGMVMIAFSAVTIVGVPGGLALANHVSWHAPFALTAAFAVILLSVVFFVLPAVAKAPSQSAETAASHIAEIVRHPHLSLGLVFFLFLICGQFLVIPFLSPSLVLNLGVPQVQLPWVYFAGGLISIVANPLFGRLSDRFGHRRFASWGIPLSILPLYLVTTLTPKPLVLILLVTTSFFMAMSARMIPSMALMTSLAPARWRGGYMSLVSTIQQWGAAISAYFAGRIVVEDSAGRLLHYDVLGLIAVGLSLVSVVVLRAVRVR